MSEVDLPTEGSVGSINGWWDQPTAENPLDKGFQPAYYFHQQHCRIDKGLGKMNDD
jgi:hypothetical protein